MNIFSLVFPFRNSLLSSIKPKVTFFLTSWFAFVLLEQAGPVNVLLQFAWESSFGWGTSVAAAFHFVNVFLVALWCLSTLIQPTAVHLYPNLVTASNASQFCSCTACWLQFLLKACWITLLFAGDTVHCPTHPHIPAPASLHLCLPEHQLRDNGLEGSSVQQL